MFVDTLSDDVLAKLLSKISDLDEKLKDRETANNHYYCKLGLMDCETHERLSVQIRSEREQVDHWKSVCHKAIQLKNSPATQISQSVYILSAEEDKELAGAYLLFFVDEEFPTEAVETVRHGRWVYKQGNEYFHIGYFCSVCDKKAHSSETKWLLSDYCPNCGAKMDLKKEA